jgi:hypothetical protein
MVAMGRSLVRLLQNLEAKMADHLVPVPSPRMRAALRGCLGVAVALSLLNSAGAGPNVERVRGFFCNDKTDQVAFLALQARGENEEMAANAVNKRIAKFSCAYYTPAKAIHTGEQTVIEEGLVFKLQSYLFLPEKVERWSGTVFGAMPSEGSTRADI